VAMMEQRRHQVCVSRKPRNFSADFGHKNSNFILKTNEFLSLKPLLILKTCKKRPCSTSGSYFYKWFFGPEKCSDLSKNAPQDRCVSTLSEQEMEQILTEQHFKRTTRITNWSAGTFKCKYFRFKVLKTLFAIVCCKTTGSCCLLCVYRVMMHLGRLESTREARVARHSVC